MGKPALKANLLCVEMDSHKNQERLTTVYRWLDLDVYELNRAGMQLFLIEMMAYVSQTSAAE